MNTACLNIFSPLHVSVPITLLSFSNNQPHMKRFIPYAPIFFRIVFALYLYTAIKFKAYELSAVESFSKHLADLKFPFPYAFAFVGTWMVLIAYVLLIIGWKARWAAVAVAVYFGVALFLYHIPNGHGASKMMPALGPLVMALFILFNGSGKPSVDEGV
jgi:putative oxidoreductase